jgi:hypothetical protein
MSEGQMWGLAGLRPQMVWRQAPRRTAERGGATLLALVVLASTGAASGLAGDGIISPGSCEHFVATVRTNEPGYAPGQTVIISVTQTNDGVVCNIPPQPCPAPVAVAAAYNSGGEDVWDPGAQKTISSPIVATCAPDLGPPVTWAAHSSDTQKFVWSEDQCTLGQGLPGHVNPGCPGTQVPAGKYRIVGVFYWTDGNLVGKGPSASATITISGKIPLKAAQLRP